MLWQTLPVLDLSCVSVPPALTLLAPSMHQACYIASVTIRAATPMLLWGGPARVGRLQHEAIPDSPTFKAHDAGHDAAMAGGFCLHYMKSVIEENNAPDEHDLHKNKTPLRRVINICSVFI